MNDYQRVADALKEGADPSMMCATCPWDRYCITPPTMTASDIAREQAKMKQQDEETARKNEAEGKAASIPMGSLLGVVLFGGKDTQAQVCPVFAARLRSSNGRVLADTLKGRMLSWDDTAVSA